MTIPLISRTNTIDEWRVQTNQSAATLNTLESGTYSKSEGSIAISGNASIIITAQGTALQVANNVLFQKDLVVSKDVSIGTQSTGTGNTTVGGTLVALGAGSALQVANNILANADVQVARTIYTGNVSANGVVVVAGNTTSGNLTSLGRTNTVDLSVSGNGTIGGTLSVVANTTVGNLYTVGTTTTDTLLVGSSAQVTYNVGIGQNLTINNRLQVNGSSQLSNTIINGDLTVSGNFALVGSTVIDSDEILLRATTGQPYGVGYSYFGVNRGANTNAYIRWNEVSQFWDIRDINNALSYSKILTANLISNSLTSTSSDLIASSNTVGILTLQTASTGRYANSAYLHANSAYISQNSSGQYANSAYLHANSAYISQNTTGVYANTAYLHANSAFVSQNTTGSYANSAFIRANSAFNSQNTTGVYANTAYLHANSAYLQANTGTQYAVAAGIYANAVFQVANTNVIDTASSSSYANGAFARANTGVANAATADQRAVTSGSYANSAYLQANTGTQFATSAGSFANGAFSRANSAMSLADSALPRSGGTMTGTLTMSADINASGYTITAALFNGRASSANYADLAEKYTTDVDYPVGTVIIVSPDEGAEATQSNGIGLTVLGVISEKPAYLMNQESDGQAIALRGRVPVKVLGPVKKGQTLISARDGYAVVGTGENKFAIALESIGNEEGLIEAVIL